MNILNRKTINKHTFKRKKINHIKIQLTILCFNIIVIEERFDDELFSLNKIHLHNFYDNSSKKTVRADHLSHLKNSIFELILIKKGIIADDEMVVFTSTTPNSTHYVIAPKKINYETGHLPSFPLREFDFFENDIFLEFEGFQDVFSESKNPILWCWLSKSSNYKWYKHVNFDDFSPLIRNKK